MTRWYMTESSDSKYIALKQNSNSLRIEPSTINVDGFNTFQVGDFSTKEPLLTAWYEHYSLRTCQRVQSSDSGEPELVQRPNTERLPSVFDLPAVTTRSELLQPFLTEANLN